MPRVQYQDDGDVHIFGKSFEITWSASDPSYFEVSLPSLSQRCHVPGRCDAPGQLDLTGDSIGHSVAEVGDSVRLTWSYRSSIWEQRISTLSVFDHHAEFSQLVRGHGLISEVGYFKAIPETGLELPNFTIRNLHDLGRPDYDSVTVSAEPTISRLSLLDPNVHHVNELRATDSATVGCALDPSFKGGSMIFNPGLLGFVFHNGRGERLTIGLAPTDGTQNFCSFEYEGSAGFCFRIPYEVFPKVEGDWLAPSVIFAPGQSEEESLRTYVDVLRHRTGVRPRPEDVKPPWWSRPLLCGWGHQSYVADLFRVRSPADRARDNGPNLLNTQLLYEDVVRRADALKIPWGTLIIDAGWSYHAGLKKVDQGKWPDLRGFVAGIHDSRRRVVLWWGPWDCEGLGPDHCITYAGPATRLQNGRVILPGERLAPDVTVPAVRALLRERIEETLDDARGFGIDGFKLDHMSLVPSGGKLRFPHGSAQKYGIELIREYCVFLREVAKAVKPDCLIIGHAPSPYLVDCFDMLRIGPSYVPEESSFVAEMTRRAHLATLVSTDWLIDTDGWPVPSCTTLTRYAKAQSELGVPALYYVSHIDLSGEEITLEVAQEISEAWRQRVATEVE